MPNIDKMAPRRSVCRPVRSQILFVVFLTTWGGCGRADPKLDSADLAPINHSETLKTAVSIESSSRSLSEKVSLYSSQPVIDGSIVIGLDADMSSGSAASGEAIRRGVMLAIDKINTSGGLLGRPLELVVRDHRGNPDRGKNNIRELAKVRDILAVVGGIHTPVAIQELPIIHENKLIYLGPWAAGTPIVANEYSPNFVFRVSVRDEYAGGFLVQKALEQGKTRLGLLLERTAWGRSNKKAIVDSMRKVERDPVAVEWLNWGEEDLSSQARRLHEANADAVLLVCNALEGVATVRAIAKLPKETRPVIISHWGISAGEFFELAKNELPHVEVTFIQTFSFVASRYPKRAASVFESYRRMFPDCESPADIFAPAGTAHAYEIVLMIATAVRNAGTTDSAAVRRELNALTDYHGLIRDYERPFPPGHHDALTAEDFILARYDDQGTILPVNGKKPHAKP